jgi:hypothetical protein
VHDVYDLVGYSYFGFIDRVRVVVIRRRGLSSAAFKSIFDVGLAAIVGVAIITRATTAIRVSLIDMATTLSEHQY